MRKLSTYRILAAYGLCLVLVLPLGIQGVHPWVDEHDAEFHCDSDRGQLHIHDQAFAFDNCFVCTFHFSHYTELSLTFTSANPGWRFQDLLIERHQFLIKPLLSVRSSRAPPAV